MITEGGEVEFIGRLIRDSETYKNKVFWFSTMIGFKQDFEAIKKTLAGKGITSLKEAVIHQGRTRRWLLAWTFREL